MEIRRAEEIVREEYFDTKWINLVTLLNDIYYARDNGNIKGEKGFSAALFLSNLIRELEKGSDD